MILSGVTAVGAGAESANVLAGYAESLLVEPALISFRAAHDGAARGDILTKYFTGTTPKMGRNGSPTNVEGIAGVLDPRTDTLINRQVYMGLQSVTFTNTTAGAINVAWELELHE